MRRNEDALLGEVIHYYEDGSESHGVRELFDKVHGDGIPRSLGDRKLLKGAVR